MTENVDKEDKLFALIKSLNKSEKGYFKKLSKALSQGSSNNYIILYNAVEKMPVYDEQKIRILLRKYPSIVKQLPVLKSYLYNLIMKSLRLFYENDKIDFKVFNEIKNADILAKKKLFKLSILHIDIAEKIAKEKSYLANQLTVNFYKRVFLLNHIDSDWLPNFEENIAQSSTISEYYKSSLEIENLYGKLIHFYRTRGQYRSKEDEKFISGIIKKLKALNINESELNFHTRIKYLLIHKFYYEHFNNYQKSFEFMDAVVQLYNNNPDIRNSQLEHYTNTINNICSIALKCQKFQYLKTLLDSLDKEVLNLDKQYDYKMYEYLVEINLKLKNYDEVKRLTEDLLNNLGKTIKITSNERQILLKYNIILLSFIFQNYSTAIDVCNELKELSNTEIRKNLLSGARIYLCILYYKINEFELLYSTVRSTKYFLKSRDIYFEIERLILNSFQMIRNAKNKQSKKKIFENILSKVNTIIEEKPHEKNILEVCDVTIWLESEVREVSELDVISTRYKDL